MAATTANAVITAFADQLAARPGLSGVTVTSGHLFDNTPREAVMLLGVTGLDQEWAALGGRARRETFTITGTIWIVKGGAGETVIREARNRCSALLDEVAQQVWDDPTVNGTVQQGHSAQFAGGEMWQGISTDGRACQWDFSVTVAQGLRRA